MKPWLSSLLAFTLKHGTSEYPVNFRCCLARNRRILAQQAVGLEVAPKVLRNLGRQRLDVALDFPWLDAARNDRNHVSMAERKPEGGFRELHLMALAHRFNVAHAIKDRGGRWRVIVISAAFRTGRKDAR